ncbi:MAG TPA: hypothetical protein VFU62_10490, partial [Hanamia sp.]|nr:hypothetical protein [Hanamia sp.]
MNKKISLFLLISFFLSSFTLCAQVKSSAGNLLASKPPMGWMTWNYFGININEDIIKEMADAMV